MFQASLFAHLKRLGILSCQDCTAVDTRVDNLSCIPGVRPEGPDSNDLDVQAAEAGMYTCSLASNGHVLLATASAVGMCVMQHTTIILCLDSYQKLCACKIPVIPCCCM